MSKLFLLFCLFNHPDSTEGALPGADPAPFTVIEIDLEITSRVNDRLSGAVYPTRATALAFLPIQDRAKRTPVPRIHDVKFLS
jgi:hypothetical protein